MRRIMVLVAAVATLVLGAPTAADAEVSGPDVCPAVTDSVTRLFSAFFLRDPDAGGQAFWIDSYTGGRSLGSIASYFAESPEFQRRYGQLGNADFVRLVYTNVLGRDPDDGGFDHWEGRLDAGMSRGAMMVGFSESGEYVRRTGTTAPLSPWFPAGSTFYCGSGSRVQPISQPAGGAVLRISMPGDGYRSIVSRGADLSYGDLLVNTTDPYVGDRIVGYGRPWIWPAAALLEIDSDGPWAIAVAPLAFARTSNGTASGTGDSVIWMNRGPGVVNLTHSGSSNFAIWAGSAGDADLVVNEIGSYDGQRVAEVGPAYWQIDADGAWSVTFQ